MQSLRQLAIGRIPVVEIWERGLLGEESPLPSGTKQELASRLTLENLYQEGSLDADLDLDLLAYILDQQRLGNLLLPYLFNVDITLDEDIINLDNDEDVEDIFAVEAIHYNQLNVELSGENFTSRLRIALQEFLNDLVAFLESPGLQIGGNYSFGLDQVEDVYRVIVWDRQRSGYRLFNIDHTEYGVEFTLVNADIVSLDDLLRNILLIQESLTGRLFIGVIPVNTLPSSIRCALQCFDDGSSSENWERLKDNWIKVGSSFQMTPKDIVELETIRRIGDYLYIETNDNVPYYEGEDIFLILNLLPINVDTWQFMDNTILA